MFGAWQAGAWKILSEWFHPDLVVGTSAGALNGWAIAGGCQADELVEQWLEPSHALRVSLRRPWRGVFDASSLESSVRSLYERSTPRVPTGVVAVELRRMKPRLFRTPGADWRHLLASCSVPFALPPVRIEGALYCDGGLLSPLPLWAAAEMGARRILALNALPFVPSRVVRCFVKTVRTLAGAPHRPAGIGCVVLSPSQRIERMRDLLLWDQTRAARAIEMGMRDARNISVLSCSERK